MKQSTARPQLVCGKCGPCLRGQYNACKELKVQGVQASLDVLIANVEKGGEVIILGVYAKNPTVNMYFVGEHELNLFGSMMYRHEDYQEAVKLISEGKIILDPLISKHFPFDQYLDAFKFIGESADKVMKVMVDL